MRPLGAFLPSPCENREFVMIGWCGSEFSILRDRLFEASLALLASLFSLYENREFVDRGLGGAEYVILRGGFSREEGNSFSFAQISLLLFVKFAEFVFDKTVSRNSCSQNPHKPKYGFAPIHKQKSAFSSWSAFGMKWSGAVRVPRRRGCRA